MSGLDQELPAVIPVFPLAGALLLPGGQLPLNIFEPRYLAMTRDAMAGSRVIGMIQPLEDQAGAKPALYATGCAGRVSQFAETNDGRFRITLTGLCRFHVAEELSVTTLYRQVRADYGPFRADLAADHGALSSPGREHLVAGLKAYLQSLGLQADWDAVSSASDSQLVTALAQACPFDPPEKQALLEAATLDSRAETLMTLMRFAAQSGGEAPPVRH